MLKTWSRLDLTRLLMGPSQHKDLTKPAPPTAVRSKPRPRVPSSKDYVTLTGAALGPTGDVGTEECPKLVRANLGRVFKTLRHLDPKNEVST